MKRLTIGQLIKELQKLDPRQEVYGVIGNDDDYFDITEVECGCEGDAHLVLNK